MKLPTFLRSILAPDSALPKRTSAAAAMTVSAADGVRQEVYTAEALLSISAASRCVQVISDMISGLPAEVYRRRGEIWVPDTTPQALRVREVLNVAPSWQYNASDMTAACVARMLIDGNYYLLPVKDSAGMLQSLEMFDRYCVTYDHYNGLYTIADPLGHYSGVYDVSDVIHVKNRTLDGHTGIGVLSSARRSLSLMATGEDETLNRFTGGGNDRFFLSTDSALTGLNATDDDDEMEKLALSLEAKKRAGRHFLAIDQDIKATPLSFSSADLEFLATRKFGVREICRFFGVPPLYVYDDGAINYKSAEMDSVAFMQHTLAPIITRIEQEYTRKLLPRSEWGRKYIRLDRDSLYACDIATQLDNAAKRIAAGIDTPNEARLRANKAGVPGGDEVYVSANLRPLNEVITTPDNENNG